MTAQSHRPNIVFFHVDNPLYVDNPRLGALGYYGLHPARDQPDDRPGGTRAAHPATPALVEQVHSRRRTNDFRASTRREPPISAGSMVDDVLTRGG